jgi:hypothetical protein
MLHSTVLKQQICLIPIVKRSAVFKSCFFMNKVVKHWVGLNDIVVWCSCFVVQLLHDLSLCSNTSISFHYIILRYGKGKTF